MCVCVPAEEQVHEEVAERRRGLQCAGRGGGLPGCALCSVCPPAAGCDAGSLNGSPCSHKVTHLWCCSGRRGSREFVQRCLKIWHFVLFSSAGFYSSCLDPKAKPSRTMRSAEPSPRWCLTRSRFHWHATSVLYHTADSKKKKKLLWSSVCSELPVWGVLGGITVQVFHDIAYKAKDRQDLLAGIDEFLDEVIVLPPGEWDPAIRIEPPKNLPPPDKRSKPTRWTVSNKEGRYFDDMLTAHLYFLPQHPSSGKTCMLALTLRWMETCPTMEVTEEEEDTQSAKSWPRLAGTEPWMNTWKGNRVIL